MVVDVVGAAAGSQRLLEERRTAIPRPEVERRRIGRGGGRGRAGHVDGSLLADAMAAGVLAAGGGARRRDGRRLGRGRDLGQVRLVGQAGPDDRAQLGVDGRVGLRLAVGREPPVDLVARPLVRVLGAEPESRPRGCRDRRSRSAGRAPSGQWAIVCVGHDQVLVGHQLVDERRHGQVVGRLDLAHEAQRLAAHLVVEDELRQAEDEQEVEHPGAGHRVDARRAPRSARCRTSRRRPGRRGSCRRRGPCTTGSAGRATWRPRRRRRRAGAPRSPPSASSRSSCGTSPARRRTGPGRPGG